MDERERRLLLDRWTEDESFRQLLRTDPTAAAESIGIDLTDEGRELLRQTDWKLPDEELEPLLEKWRRPV